MVRVLKKIFKAIAWLMVSIVLLVIAITLLIQVPAVQTKLTSRAILLISKKTHTRVELKKVSITFPKSVVLKGLYLEDLNRDTLLYAGEVKVNINFRDIFKNKIHVNSFLLENTFLDINRTERDSLFNFNFLITAFTDTTDLSKVKPEKPAKWTFSLDNVSLKKIRIRYDDKYGGINAALNLKYLKLKMDRIDLEQSVFIIDELLLEGSTGDLLMKEAAKSIIAGISRLKLKDAEIDIHGDLKVTIKQIELDDSSVSYLTPGKPGLKNTFDPSCLKYEHLTLAASDIFYSSVKTEASIKKFTAIDQNNFSITGFETDFRMDPHSISAKNLRAKTTNSLIDLDLNLKYSSLASLGDSIQSIILYADMRNVAIKTSDINYFAPQLTNPSFFKYGMNTTSISGILNGTLDNLTGNNLTIRTGARTILNSDFTITGLPDYETAHFNFPNLKLNSGRQDLIMIAGPLIPENIELPADLSTQISFTGTMRAFVSTVGLKSTFGSASLAANLGKDECFSGKLNIMAFDLGRLLKDQEMFGPVSLIAELTGQGLDKATIRANIKAEASKFYLNKYNYHNLRLLGTLSGKEFEGEINLNDENAMFDFSGRINLNPNQERYKFDLNVQGADLQKLNITQNDISIGFTAKADLKGGKIDELNGQAGIAKIIIIHGGKRYDLDSLLFASINSPDKSEMNVTSSVIGLNYTGTGSPIALPAILGQYINNYFHFSGAGKAKPAGRPSSFNFELQLHNHPVISEVFLPQLKEFEPIVITGAFDSGKSSLMLKASIKKIIYGSLELKDCEAEVNSDLDALNYKIFCRSISSAQVNFTNLMLDGKLEDQTLFASISSINDKLYRKLLIRSKISKPGTNYRITIDPAEIYLMNDRWDIAPENYMELGSQGFLIHHFFMNKADSKVNISSKNDQFNDDLIIDIENFNLGDLSRIAIKDTSLVKGSVNGHVVLKKTQGPYGIIADAKISNLFIREIPIGNLTVKAENSVADKFEIDADLSGGDNNLKASGYFMPKGGDNSISIKTAVQSLSMKTVEAFSMGQLTETSGMVSGDFLIQGSTKAPEITGELVFNNVFVKPAFNNSRMELKKENVRFKEDGIYFDSFTIRDIDQHTAIIDGTVLMKQFKDLIFNLKVNTQDFLLFNTTAKDHREFFGRMIIDSRMDITGPMTLPAVDAWLKIKKGSNFTFAVPEDKLTTDKGEDVVEFLDQSILNPILLRSKEKGSQKSSIKGFEIASVIEIDKQATLKLLMDPASTDSLVVRGDAALSFALDRSGKMSLTGAYDLNEGSYLVSVQSVIKRRFDIVPGSTIIWNGDPLDAAISVNATYSVRASPYDLVVDQVSGLTDADKSGYKQRYPFLVFLKLRGELLHPQISFEIQLAPVDKGILGGVVNQKLILLNEDESALNKQVFALLVLGRFIQENPLQTESGETSALVRSTVGKFLSAQLNQLSSKLVPGVELNFDIQSYNDYQTGQAEGRTEVEIGLKKQLFNERLSIQLGGTIDVEGDKAKQNTASDITSDVTVEYKLTKDGRFRLKAFRHNQYEGAIEGQLVETGAGVLFVRDFNKWKQLFTRQRIKRTNSKTTPEQ